MKKVFLVCLGVLLVALSFSSVYAVDKTLTFGWEYNKADYPSADGFRFYKGSTSGSTPTLQSDFPKSSLTTTDFSDTVYSIEKDVPLTNIPANALTEYFFTATAYNEFGESEKSAEVSVVFDFLNPPSISDLAAQFNDSTATLTFTWTYQQDWLGKILRWELYQSDTSGGPYQKVVGVPYDPNASQPYTTDVAISIPSGDKITRYYTMVAVRPAENNYAASADSNEVTVTINKMPPKAPFEFKIRVK